MSTHAASVPAPLGVLICDDNESIRNALRDVIGLRPSLSVVGVAADGNEAITQAAQGEFIRYDVDVIGRASGQEIITVDFNIQPVLTATGPCTF